MSSLTELYQNVILEHNRSPRNYRVMDDADRQAEGNNPLCGDQLTVWLKLDGDVISDVAFQGLGCAISRASASLMTAAVKGKSRREAEDLHEHPLSWAAGGGPVRAVPPPGHRQAGTGRLGNFGEARCVLGDISVPDPGEVREPAVAHPEGGAG